MTNTWTVMWSQDRVKQAIAAGGAGKPLTHLFGGSTPSPSPMRFKVQPQDEVYVVSVQQKHLFLLGRLFVSRVMPLTKWAQEIVESEEDADVQAMKALAQAPPPNPQAVLSRWLEENNLAYLVPQRVYIDAVAEGMGTALQFDVAVPQEILAQVSFLSSEGELPLFAPGETKIIISKLHGMYRRLTPATSRLLAPFFPGEVTSA